MAQPHLAEHYEDLRKQTHAARIGMWVFLASETLLFAALFALYASYRVAYPRAFHEGVHLTDLFLGTLNTYVLITSSFTMALSIYATRRNAPRAAFWLLLATFAMGIVFLILKGVEYSAHFKEGMFPGERYHAAALPTHGGQLFFSLYYYMTGLHALHVIAGMAIIAWLAWRVHKRRFTPDY